MLDLVELPPNDPSGICSCFFANSMGDGSMVKIRMERDNEFMILLILIFLQRAKIVFYCR